MLPGIALAQIGLGHAGGVIAGIFSVLSLFTFFIYRSDKFRAESGSWRIPESTLHLAELAGGWPGAFFAQQCYRHKTSKLSFQITFWAIVMLHQGLALDYLIGWKLTENILSLFQAFAT